MYINEVKQKQSNESFKGIYKLTSVNVKSIENEKEKQAMSDCLINSVILGVNLSIDDGSKVGNDKQNPSSYFKIDDKNDKLFENRFKEILNDCNKKFNLDLASKVYIQKVDEDEYEKAQYI